MVVGLANHFNLKPTYAATTIEQLIGHLEQKIAAAGPLVRREGAYQFAESIPYKLMPEQLLNTIKLGEELHPIRLHFKSLPVNEETALREMREVVQFMEKNTPDYGFRSWNGYVPEIPGAGP